MATIDRPRPADVDEIVSLWVELAEGQRRFGSHLRAAVNRDVIRSQIARSLPLGEVLVARAGEGRKAEGREGDVEGIGGVKDGDLGDEGDLGSGDVGADDRGGGGDDGGDEDDKRGDGDGDLRDGGGNPGDRGGDIVGFVTYGPDTGSYEQDVSRGTIHNVFVRDPYRGRGIGTSLLEAAEAELARDGIDVVSIGAMAENVNARRLYRKMGYRPHRVELEKQTETPNHSSEND